MSVKAHTRAIHARSEHIRVPSLTLVVATLYARLALSRVRHGCTNVGRSLYAARMSHIEKRTNGDGSIVWRVRWRESGAYLSETFATRDEATKFRGLVDAAGQRTPDGWVKGYGFARTSDPALPSLREWCARALAARSTANDRTRSDYVRTIERHVPSDLLDEPLDAITRERMGVWLIELQARVAPKTAKNVHGLLSSVMNDAADAGLIARNPMKGLIARLPAKHDEPVSFLTPDEFAVVLDCTPEHYRPLVLTFARTGMRFGEATALTVSSVEGSTLRIDKAWKRNGDGTFYVGSTKSRRSRRVISLDSTTLHVLEPLLARDRDALLFTTDAGSRVAHSNFTNRVWYRVLDKAEPVIHKRPRVHDLRHTHASWLIAAGVPLPAIQARLGHESITTTIDLYGHLMPDADRDAVDALARLLDDR